MDMLSASERKRFAVSPVRCPQLPQKIRSLADYFAVISDAIRTTESFWFRGHEDIIYRLTPSALRYAEEKKRAKALALMAEFKRIADTKLPRPPLPEKELEWSLLAQHYGLPTRLLDWTESATTALYFACLKEHLDGIVLMVNPIDLNRLSYPTKPRVLDPQQDSETILRYLRAGSKQATSGRNPVAIYPVWNSPRLIMQKGVFTLHGSRFELQGDGVPSLAGIPILKESKAQLIAELQRIGVDEMTLFPELEHSCAHLKRKEGLHL